MKSIWDAAARRELHDRVTSLAWDRRAAWGRFTAPKMVCHLAESLKMALGDLPVVARTSPIRYPPLKQLIVYALPFPKGVPTAPELLAREPKDWAADVGDVHALLDRAAGNGSTDAWPDHPAFGRLSRRAWGVLIYRHMDHHLRQFGT
jgi:Protein of unknown function (DUF1569)